MPMVDYIDFTEKSDGSYALQYSSDRLASFIRNLTTFDWTITMPMQFSAKRISYFHYGTVDYWWAICKVNGVVNPYKAFAPGRTIKVPTLDSISAAAKTYASAGSDNTGSEAGSTVTL